MRISKIAAHCFEIWYASRVSIAAASAFLAATSSRILNGEIDWRAVAVVALCAFAAYHSDDYVDFSRDLPRSPLHLFAGLRLIKLLAAIASIAIVIAILRGRPTRLAELLLISGLLTLAFCLASSRIRDEVRSSQLWFGLRTVYLSLVWSLVVVLTPVLDQSGPLDRRVTGAILFIFALMLSVSAIWTEGEHPERREREPTPKAYDRMMLLGCAYASGLVIYGIAKRIFPWQNLALLPACAINALFILIRRRFDQVDRRVINEALILMNLMCCLFVLGAYAYPNEASSPKTFTDWFQLAACVLFFGNIAVKWSTLKARDDDGDYVDLLIILGLAIFGFQIFVACVHVERWLFPLLHWSLFHDRAASAAGVLLTSIALILQSAAYISMSDSWRLMARSRELSGLVTTGPFALTRNPVYVSTELYIAGALLMNGTLVFALFVLIAPLVIHAQIRREEAFLFHRHAGSYGQYLKKTPRYIAF